MQLLCANHFTKQGKLQDINLFIMKSRQNKKGMDFVLLWRHNHDILKIFQWVDTTQRYSNERLRHQF